MSQVHTLHSADGIYVKDDAGDIMLAQGTTVPADAVAGYGTGAIFIDRDASAGSVIYVNNGSRTSAAFDAVAVTGGSFAFDDDALLGLGTGSTARFSYDTTDANANALLLQLPAAGAVDVPVLVIGQSVESVDLGLYNGVTEPRVAMFGVGAVTTGPVLEFRKARGTVAAPTVVTAGDDLGTILFYSAVAAGEYVLGASIRADSAGSPATTRGAANLSFNVATDAAPSVFTERLLITAEGQINLTPGTDFTIANGKGVIIGHAAQVAAGAVTSEFQMHGTAPADSTALLAAWSADAVPPRLYFAKSRSATIGTFGIITTGDNLGEILAFGDDGVDFNSNGNASCAIIFDSAGTIAADRIAGVIRLQTATDAQPSVLTTALTIDQAQLVTCAAGLTLTTGDLTFSAASDVVVLANTAAALEVYDATTKIIGVDTRNTVKDVNGVIISSPATTIASETAAHENPSLKLAAKTITYTGGTATTSQLGSMLNVGVLTLTDTSAMTLTTASAVHINAVAAAGGMLTISNSYMISTSVSDCFLTNAGAWTDTMCWARGKENIEDAPKSMIASMLDKLTPRTWKYREDNGHGNDHGLERVGIVYDDLPDELRMVGNTKAVSAGLLSSFALAALRFLKDENDDLRRRLDRLEAAV